MALERRPVDADNHHQAFDAFARQPDPACRHRGVRAGQNGSPIKILATRTTSVV